MIITIDGPAGTGKTTVAKKVAERLHFAHFDTGALYRAFAWYVLKQGIDPLDEQRIAQEVASFHFEMKIEGSLKRYLVGDKDVTEEIRSQEISSLASTISVYACVRSVLLRVQREFVAQGNSAVFEGRDLGTVVFPQAEVKIFLTARLDVRAKRRREEMVRKNPALASELNLEKMQVDLEERDKRDATRRLAPLKCAKDAYQIDTSDLTIDEVVDKILAYQRTKSARNVRRRRSAWSYWGGMSVLYRFVLLFTWIIFKVFYRYRVYGLEHYCSGAAIIAANHTSFLDPPIAAISWPEEVHFLARSSLFDHRFFGALITALNSHPVSGDVGDVAVFKTICSLLNEGKKVVLFPEGERSFDNELGQIKPGIALLISRTDAAIIPTYIAGTYDIWKRGRRFPKLWGKTACVFGSPIYWESFAHLDKKEAQKAVAEQLYTAITALKAWYAAGASGSPP